MAQKCENCGKELQIEQCVYSNASTYQNTNLAISFCCGTAYYVRPVVSFVITKYTGTRKDDDWGNKIDNNKQN